ncbi:hypothetical protein LINPERHAP2_LOCUS32759 [Linum perenne]
MPIQSLARRLVLQLMLGDSSVPNLFSFLYFCP